MIDKCKFEISAPWEQPNPYTEWFDEFSSVSALANTEVMLVDFILPTASYGVIKWLGQGLSDDTKYGDVTWQLRVNNSSVNKYSRFVGRISTMLVPTDIFVFLKRGAHVTLTATSISALTISGRVKGWFWADEQHY